MDNIIRIADSYSNALKQKQIYLDQRKSITQKIKQIGVDIDSMENILLIHLNEHPDNPIPLRDGRYLIIGRKMQRKMKNKQEKDEALEKVMTEIQSKKLSPERSVLKIKNAMASNSILKPQLYIKTAKELLTKPLIQKDIVSSSSVNKDKKKDKKSNDTDDDISVPSSSPSSRSSRSSPPSKGSQEKSPSSAESGINDED